MSAVTGISLCGGGDEPEAQLNALWEICEGGDSVSFRDGSSRIVVWFGDAPGHDPSLGHTEADATASLVDVEARVLAVSVGANRLDLTGETIVTIDPIDAERESQRAEPVDAGHALAVELRGAQGRSGDVEQDAVMNDAELMKVLRQRRDEGAIHQRWHGNVH